MPCEHSRQQNPLNINELPNARPRGVTAAAGSDPARPGAVAPSRSTVKPSSEKGDGAERQQKPKALVVEDYTPCMDAYKMALEDVQSVEVFYAECGQDAINLIKQHDFCIVITDLGLPDYSGYEIKEEHGRLKPDDRHTRFVLVTGYDSEEQRKKSRDLGFDEHIEKPISILRLLNLIDDCAADNNPAP